LSTTVCSIYLQLIFMSRSHPRPEDTPCMFRNVNDTVQIFKTSKISKAVPLHAMEAHGGRGGIAPTHS
jgi:hypothetical protein